MADTQPSNSELIAPHLSSAPICHDCGLRFESFNTLYNHIEYYHKNQFPKWYHQPSPHASDPNSNFNNKPDESFVKPEHNEYIDTAANNYKSEIDNFPKSELNFAPSEPHYSKPNQYPYKNSVKSEQHEVNSSDPNNSYANPENQFSYKSDKIDPTRESYSPHYEEPPVQSPSHNHREFSTGFPTNGFRPKNGAGGPESQIFDLDAQRVNNVYQPPPPPPLQLPPHLNQKPLPLKHLPQPGIPHQMEEAYDTVSTTTTSPPDSKDLSQMEQPYPKKAGSSKSGGSWKSNEARRPKTYLCTACNKWFTSSGHLKRHYNTTLHKNAVKQTGQPDPCTLPVSTHHHPYRDPNYDSSAPPRPSKSNGRASNNFSPRTTNDTPNGTPTPDQVPPEQHLTQHAQPPPHMMHPPTPPSQPQSFRDPQFSPKMSVEPSYSSPGAPKDPSYVLNNNYSQDPPNLMAGPSETSEGLLPPPPPTSFYQPPLMPLPTYHQPPPHTSIQSHQNYLPLPTNYPNFQAPHVSSTHPGININLIGNIDVLGQHVDEKAFIPLLMQATRDSNTLIQLQRQYVAMNIPEEYVGGLPSPQDLDFSTENPESSGTSFNESAQVSSTSYVNYSYQSGTGSHSALSPDSAFSPSCSFDNNNTVSAEDLEKESKPLLNFIKTDIIFSESTTPDENSSNVISSTNQILPDSLLSPDSMIEDKVGDPLADPLRCDDCDKVFNKSCYLKQHNRCFHSGDKPFKCPRCGKRFMEQLQCEEHLTKHGGDKPHKCDVCPKSFHHKTDLRRHSYSHNAEKPYVCPLCNKGFIRKDHMLKHTNIHRRKSNASFDNSTFLVNNNIYASKEPESPILS